MKTIRNSCLAALACAVLFLASCGGGGGGSGAPANVPVTSLESSLAGSVDPNNPVVTPLYNAMSPDADPPSPGTQSQQGITQSPDGGSNGSWMKVYTPAQIRVAYRMPALPSDWTHLSDTQAADMGAGQTIYIITAFDAPNIERELDAFNTQFGLPGCTRLLISATRSLPIDAASGNACLFAKVYASANNGLADAAPLYDSSWAREAALDVQWAHATAPLARIILIEAVDASMTSMLSAINLANAMGPGVVSMSFGTPEGSWVSDVDSAFGVAHMSYVAATGDSGTGVAQWPAVSSQVLGVGATTLSGYTASSRHETVWADTGGGRSSIILKPAYQSSSVPGWVNSTYRSLSDVSFNGDPYTGQYVATIAQGASGVSWISMGGTSLGTPQWAGMIAVIRAHRVRQNQSVLAAIHSPLYQAASGAGFYGASAPMIDVISGSSGGVPAGTGYDLPSGLGSPNLNALVALLAPIGGAVATGTAPSLTADASVNGTVGTALTIPVTVTAANAVTWSISGAPSGMSINANSGVVSWPSPVAGTTSIVVTATDNINHLSGSVTVTINIAASAGSQTSKTATFRGNQNVPLTVKISATNGNPMQYVLDSMQIPAGSTLAPSGLNVSAAGVISWAKPVQGTTTLSVTATDVRTHATTQWTISLIIGGPLKGPVISNSPIQGNAGMPLSALISIRADADDDNVTRISIGVSGMPAGMRATSSTQGVTLSWAKPTAGTYVLGVTATDSSPNHGNQSNQTQVTVTIQ